MKRFFVSAALLMLISCGSSTTEKKPADSTATTTTQPAENTASAQSSNGDTWDTSKWPKLDLSKYNIPLTLHTPPNPDVMKSLNEDHPDGAQIIIGLDYVYDINPVTESTVAGAVAASKKIQMADSKNFKLLKEDTDGYIYSYVNDDGNTEKAFFYAVETGGKVYGISASDNNTETTNEQMEKLYTGAKTR